MTQPTCEERINAELANTMEDIRQLWESYLSGEEEDTNLECNIWEYGLAFEYVPADTFSDQEAGFFRWQLSTGGPGDEFRFYTDATLNVYKVEYVFLDWFDGASRRLYDENRELLEEIFEDLREIGCVKTELEKATHS